MAGLFVSTPKVKYSNATQQPAAVGMRIQTSVYGLVIPIIYGANRVSGNMVWYNGFRAIAHTEKITTQSGKGGSSKKKTTEGATTYTYQTSFILALAHGEISGIGKVWLDKSESSMAPFTLFRGTPTQDEWGYLASGWPVQTLKYRNIAYVAAADYDLGTSTNPPSMTFEVLGRGYGSSVSGKPDVDAATIIEDFLTNSRYGARYPAAMLGDLADFRNYCIAANLLFSPIYDSAQEAQQTVLNLLDLTNSDPYFSEGKLKIKPFADSTISGNGVTWSPNLQAVYDLGDGDFLRDGDEPPIMVKRADPADAYNCIKLEVCDRSNSYNLVPVSAKDQVAIDMYGLREMSTITAHEVCDTAIGQAIAQAKLQKVLHIRNRYEFRLSLRYILLEPTDYVTITDERLGLILHPVRIVEIEVSDDELSIVAEDAPHGARSVSPNTPQTASRYSHNFSVDPGNTAQPFVFEPPTDVTGGTGLELWVQAYGGAEWGGCEVWVSVDGESYSKIGTIDSPARAGILTDALLGATDPDSTSTLNVDLSATRAQIIGTSDQDWNAYSNLAIIDDELIAFRDAELTGSHSYALSTLHRGVYWTTSANHSAGSRFLRIDPEAALAYPVSPDRIGTRLWIKLPAYNRYGASLQSIDQVEPYEYTITGRPLRVPMPDIKGLTSSYTNSAGGITKLQWKPVQDFRQPAVDYEVRIGSTWSSGMVLGRTKQPEFTCSTNGTYWIAAHYTFQDAVHVYSANPQPITVTTAMLVKNVVAKWDEEATGWTGNKTDGLDIDPDTGALTINTSIATSGIYTIPDEHHVDVGRVTPCNIILTYSALGVSLSPESDVLTWDNVLDVADVLGATLGRFLSVQPQISTAGEDGNFSEWQDYVPGYYNARYFRARIAISTSDAGVTFLLSDFSLIIDVPDRIETVTTTTSAAGLTAVLYEIPFHGGVGSDASPRAHVTIINQQAGDYAVVTGESIYGFSVGVKNGGNYVIRTVNCLTQGY